ncbi:MAG: tRNA (N(6)-L-threonylcarbamoyladenosine(37)-C(2))-methylthiotransferase MtaB, partial [Defluviitaleaceae bacterium]|nr:tRNA (N(6)-L-threonylcarbamoyladenosine(37)-C(2))-methylthiotransferase MtaB [Defluviitaleaceae bacterium]
MRVAAATLGCKVNQYETEKLMGELLALGYAEAQPDSAADLCIVNTCAVTQTGDKKSRQLIRRAREKNPDAAVVVLGCYTETDPAGAGRVADEIGGACLLLGTKDRNLFAQKIFFAFPPSQIGGSAASAASKRVRAYVKIQDGCDNYCSYCIVPYARGPSRSRPLDQITDEINLYARRGCGEIVLTAIHAASYGKDTNGMRFNGLLAEVHEAAATAGVARVRLGSLDPCAVDGEFIRGLNNMPLLCSHFHLSLQSGCDRTLAAMNRRYDTARYAETVRMLRAARPDAALTTDIIAGFPGETEADFEQSCNFFSGVGFMRAHVFEYSKKKGTAAAAMPDQVPGKIKTARAKILRGLAEKSFENFIGSRIGNVYSVLIESHQDGYAEGCTDNYIHARFKCTAPQTGRFAAVRLER